MIEDLYAAHDGDAGLAHDCSAADAPATAAPAAATGGVVAHDVRHRLALEGAAAQRLLAACAVEVEGDAELQTSLVAGHTSLFEVMEMAIRREGELLAHARALDEQATQLGARRERFAAQRQRIREALGTAMVLAGLDRHESATATLSVVSGRRVIDVYDWERLPEAFRRRRDPVPDKDAIGAALRRGENVPGVREVTGRPSLAIRRK